MEINSGFRKSIELQIRNALGKKLDSVKVKKGFPFIKNTLPETNMAHEKSTILMVFTRKDGDFHGLC